MDMAAAQIPQIPQTRDPRTHAILGVAMYVHRQLGHGFLERIYHEAMVRKLQERGIETESEVGLAVLFDGAPLSAFYRCDLLCFGQVIVELKAQKTVGEVEESQVIHYLKASGMRVGLLINFGKPSLEWRRFALGDTGYEPTGSTTPDRAPDDLRPSAQSAL